MPSTLAAHILESSASAFDFTTRSKAGAVKLVNAFSQAADYRRANPNILIVARNVLDKDDRWRDYAHNPQAFFDTFTRPHLEHPANKDIDVWETNVNEDGPRKIDGTDLLDISDMALRARFEAVQAELIAKAGNRPAVGHLAVGNPSGTQAEQLAAWRAYVPALKAAHAGRGYVAVHVYFDVSGWELAVRSLIQVLAENAIPLQILITECGLANGSRGVNGAWYAQRTMQFDQQLRAEFPRVAYAFIYSFGGGSTGGWNHFNVDSWPEFLEPVIAYGASQTPPPVVPPPARPVTNQEMLNIVRQVTGRAVGDVIPYDVLQAMVLPNANRQKPYTGPDPFQWGPTSAEKLEIKKRAGL